MTKLFLILGLFLGAGVFNTLKAAIIQEQDLNFSEGRIVVSSAPKIVFSVPLYDKEISDPLVNPETGKPLLTWDGKKIGTRGLVFFNGKDQTFQGCLTNGKAVIIINNPTKDQYDQIVKYMAYLRGKTVKQFKQQIQQIKRLPLSFIQLKKTLVFIQETLGIVDMYDSTAGFIKKNMIPVDIVYGEAPAILGFYKRNGAPVRAVYVPGSGSFQGPAATPQVFENGAYIVKDMNKPKEAARLIQPEVFLETYTNKDGSPINW